MTWTEIENAIRTRFHEQVETSLYTVYDNQDKQAPTDNSMWCRLSIRPGSVLRTTVGVKEYRYVGVIFAQLFGPLGTGDGDLMEMAESIAAVFRSQTVSGVTYLTPRIEKVGQGAQQYQVNVEIDYQANDQE